MASSLPLRASSGVTCTLSGPSPQQEAASRLAPGALKASKGPVRTSFSFSAPTSSPSVRSVVAQVAADPKTTQAEGQTTTRYHFVVANAKFMLDEEEHFQEQLKERLRWVNEQGRGQDFWLLYEPAFLESFPEITKRLKRPAVALVSTDSLWITFMKTRLDRVLLGEFEADSLEDALKAKPIDITFEKPARWTAPYTKYEADWWKPYVPQ